MRKKKLYFLINKIVQIKNVVFGDNVIFIVLIIFKTVNNDFIYVKVIMPLYLIGTSVTISKEIKFNL